MPLPIKVNAHASTWFRCSNEIGECPIRVRKVMEDTERIHIVEPTIDEWQREKIGLNAVDVADIGDVSRGLIDCTAKVHRDNLAGVFRDLAGMSAHAATCVEDGRPA